MDGTIVKVKESFVKKFLGSKEKDKIEPTKKDIEETYDSVSGRWLDTLLIGEHAIYNIGKDIPHQMVDYEFPLNSNSNYREDLLYRKKNDLARSQMEK